MDSVWKHCFLSFLGSGPRWRVEDVCASTAGVCRARTAELPGRFEEVGVGLGRGRGAPFKVVWVLPTPAEEP